MLDNPYHLVFTLLLIGMLLAIFYQDLKYRAVWWGNFVALIVFVVLYQLKYQTGKEILYNAMINFSFLFLLFLFLAFYFLIRYKKLSFFNQYLGYGDAIFLFIVGLKFSLHSFIIFLVSGNLIILVFIILNKNYRRKDYLVPYAGVLALILIPWIMLADFFKIDFFVF